MACLACQTFKRKQTVNKPDHPDFTLQDTYVIIELWMKKVCFLLFEMWPSNSRGHCKPSGIMKEGFCE